ncbi:MAG: hypothetical protein NTZ12_02775 [Candidatus Aminicenantes bacterium]|nr:hypothetical protein [Candidatus Aminicenantes bacterium]
MKKILIMLFGLLLVSGIYAESNSLSFVLNFGTMTDKSFTFDPFYWTVGAELDLPFGNALMLSPEVILVGSGTAFKDFLLFPAVILNFTPSSFFVGGGLTKGFYLSSGTSTAITDVALKLNAGFLTRSLKLTAYLITPFNNIFKDMLVGASLGFMF